MNYVSNQLSFTRVTFTLNLPEKVIFLSVCVIVLRSTVFVFIRRYFTALDFSVVLLHLIGCVVF
jgi:hypothetical protein